MYSALTRMTIDKTILNDILTNRKNHNIFLDLEKDNENEKKWTYLDSNGNIYGLLSSKEMNERFQLTALTPETKIKRKFDDDYFTLKVLIKRYYKKILCEKLNIEVGPKKLSKRTLDFKNGEKILRKGVIPKKERYEPKGRSARVKSDNIRPEIGLIDNLEEILMTRARANTTASRN